MNYALTEGDRQKLIQQGLLRLPEPPAPNKGGRPRNPAKPHTKVRYIIAPQEPQGPSFKTTPGPAQGVEYKSPYRHITRRKGS